MYTGGLCSLPARGISATTAAAFVLGLILGAQLIYFFLPSLRPAACDLDCSISGRPDAQLQQQDIASSVDVPPFYIDPSQSTFRQTAYSVNPVTDKVTATTLPAKPNGKHAYDALYSLFFEGQGRRMQRLKVLEIGLGCDSEYGPTASARAWRKYLPNAELWVAEYNTDCLQRQAGVLADLNIHTISGDQGNNVTLHSWVQETGGNFDVIIDDGGHQNHQQYNTFAVLFHKALKPGGIFFLEDLQVSRYQAYRGPPGSPIMAAVITDWIESLLAPPAYGNLSQLTTPGLLQPAYESYKAVQRFMTSHGGDSARLPTWVLPTGVKVVTCQSEMCAFTKCTQGDPFCPLGVGKQSLDL